MLRGKWHEIDARMAYEEHSGNKVDTVGFITNDKWGFTIGYSPDGLVGEDGCIEIKTRKQKYQAETILLDKVPDEYVIQVQTALLVSERKWCDFISYCGGMHLYVKRIEPDANIQQAIIDGAKKFYTKMDELVAQYKEKTASLFLTDRKFEEEMTL
jgi:predicted phage-related endonuclease